jgi:hypothetical protein
MDRKERIQELEKLLKILGVDKAMALNSHQYQLVAQFKDYEKALLDEKEWLEREEKDEFEKLF